MSKTIEIEVDDYKWLKSLELAYEGAGIYPKSVVGGKEAYEERTPYMEGWNAYGTALIESAAKISKWLDTVPEEVFDLVSKDKLEVHVSGDTINLYVNCNDLFFWACSDAEPISLEEIPEFLQALKEADHGDILWCCRKRGMRPQKPYYKYFSEAEKQLFDACGPERDQ